ncbi:MAG: TolC family protein [Rikenellaceae bacterium]
MKKIDVNNMKKSVFVIILLIILTPCYAQMSSERRVFSLNDCMKYAVENNTGVKKQNLLNNNYRQDFNEAIASLFPSIGGGVSLNSNSGRSVNPETNTYSTTSNIGNSYSLSANMPIFNGLAGINTIRMSHVMKLMGIEQLQRIEDEVAIKTMQAYFDVVYFTSCVTITKQQIETSGQVLFKSKKLEELGLKSAADVAQIEAQVASDDLLLIQQQNKLEVALLSLKQQMNYPIKDTLEVDTDTKNIGVQEVDVSLGDAVDYALNNNPKMLESNYNLRSTMMNYKIAKGRLYPSISLGGGYSTNFYKNFNSDEKTIPFVTQFRENRGFYVGASLSIPIFGGLRLRTTVNRSRNNMQIAEQQNVEAQREIELEVTQATLEMDGYSKEYIQADKKVEAADLAHQASLNKYEQGIVSAIDMQTTSNTLLLAKSQRLNAQLQYIIKTYLVEYYNGKSLIR